MTTVLALARGGRVVMAADTLTNVYERPIPDGARKIARLPIRRTTPYDGRPPELLIGTAGAGGLLATVRRLEPPLPPTDGDLQAWADEIARAVTTAAVDAGLTDEGRMDGTLLLGWAGQLWTLTHYMAIPHADGVAALGSGEGPAIGALDVLLEAYPTQAPGELLTRALRVAAARDRHTGGSVQLELLEAR